ncbi:MAG: alpha/beta fold hydrolase [Pseudobdellovibrionaceae bacterium]
MGINIFLLHGFLGLPQDMEPLEHPLRAKFSARQKTDSTKPDLLEKNQSNSVDLTVNRNEIRFIRVSLWNLISEEDLSSESSGHGFDRFAKAFLQKFSADLPVQDNFLVGYSLGGRLCLSLLENDKQGFFKKVFLLSAHPGLVGPTEVIQERQNNDKKWAEVFLQKPWDEVLQKWNSQDVFQSGATEPVRIEYEFSKNKLAYALTAWSLALQKDHRPLIQQKADQVSVFVGEKDHKFLQVWSDVQKQMVGKLSLQIISQAGHRLHLDQPQAVADAIADEVLG